MACEYTYNGKTYTEQEFKVLLATSIIGKESSVESVVEATKPPEPPKEEKPKEEKKEPPKEKRRFTQQFIKEYPHLAASVSEEAIFYNRLPNKVSLSEANALVDYLGEQEARKAFSDLNNGIPSGVRMTLGQVLIKRFEASGDYDSAIDLLEETTKRATELGQEIQALSMFSLLSPEGQMRMAERTIDKGRERRKRQDKPRTNKLKSSLDKINKESVGEVLKNERIKQKIQGFEKIEPKVSVRDKSYGTKNKIVTKERYEELKKKLRGQFFSSPVQPEMIEVGLYHIEAGARSFVDFSKNLIDDFGNKVKPYLVEIYKGARTKAEESNIEGLSTDEDIKKAQVAEEGQILVKNIEKALKAKNRKASEKAIAQLQQLAKDEGLWGKYRNYAIQRLKALTNQNIASDIKENAILDEFTKGLIKNINQQSEKAGMGETAKVKPKPAIEIIADAYKNFEKYEEVWNQTIQEFKEANKGDEAKLENLDAYFGDITLKPFSEKLIKQSVKEQLKEMGVSISDVVKDHYTVYDYTLRTLTEKLIEKSGLSQAEASELATAIEKEFDSMATERKRKALEKIFSNKERKKPDIKTLESDLIRMTNLGAFDEEELLKMWAEKMGYPKLTPENIKEIQRLSNIVQESVEGFQKFRAIEDLLAYQANIKGVSRLDVALAVWYSNILSGFTTQEVNLVANLLNSGILYANAIAQNPTQARFIGAGFIEGLKRGWLESKETFRTGYSPIRGKIEVPNVLERKRFTGWKSPLNYWKYVSRTMKAADVLIFEAQKEMRAYQMAVKLAAQNPDMLEPDQTIRQKAAELVASTEGQVAEAQELAEMEYEQTVEDIESQNISSEEKSKAIKQAAIDKKRRVYEILEENRAENIQKESADYASRGTYNYKPEGLLGWMASQVNQAKDALVRVAEESDNKVGKVAASSARVIVSTIIPFTNIIANVANENLNYTPWGFIRAASGKTTATGFNARELTNQEKVDLMTKAIIGTTLMLTIYALSQKWDDDDEPLIEITANGHGDYRKNYDLANTGWQPYSIRVGKRWYSYQYSPLMIALSFIGNINDFEKYRGEKLAERGMSGQVSVAFSSVIRSLLDMTFLSSLNEFVSAALDPRNEDAVGDFLRGVKKTATAAIVPNLYTQGAREVESIFNIPTKEIRDTYFGSILQHIPIARDQYFNKINSLGEEIIPDTDKLISKSKDDKIWNMLAEKGAAVGVPPIQSMTIYDPNQEKDVAMTQKQYYNFCKIRGTFIKETLNKEFDSWKNMKPAEFKESLNALKANATKRAKRQVIELE